MKRTLVVVSILATLLVIACPAIAAPEIIWTTNPSNNSMPSIATAPSGGVYLASSVYPFPGGGTQFATIAHYSNTGEEVWKTTIDNARNYFVQSDSLGNVYITGETYTNLNDNPSLGGSDVFLNKYSPSGTLLWDRQIGTPEYDFLSGLDVSATGTAYITVGGCAAHCDTTLPDSVTAIHQFSADGTPGWVSDLDPGNGSHPCAFSSGFTGTAIDSQGNIFAAFMNYVLDGMFHNTSSYLSKTNAEGQVQWIKPLDASNLNTIDTDSADNIILATDYSLKKYDSNGDLVWSYSDDSAILSAVIVAPDDTIYVAGNHSTNGYVAAYSSNGSPLWSQDIPPNRADATLRFQDLTLSENQLVLAGEHFGFNLGYNNYLVALAVPEPSTLLLLTSMTFLLLGKRFRIRQ